jgi:hypothetical protein
MQATQRRAPDVYPVQRLRTLIPQRAFAEDVGLFADPGQWQSTWHGRRC